MEPISRSCLIRARKMWSVGVLGVGLAIACQGSRAQTATRYTNQKFAVASVRAGDPNIRHGSLQYIPESGRFEAKAATVDQLIGFAYDVRPHQIVGGPNWQNTEGYTIEAVADESAIPIPDNSAGTQIFRMMVRQLLADRFGMVAREETREAPVYELVVDKDGPKLKQAIGVPPGGGGSVRMAPGQLVGSAAPMFILVNQLSRQLGRTVIDKTGLTGRYDFVLKWQPDSAPSDASLQTGEEDPSIFGAVREDLGLKLQSAKGPVRFVVIDQLDKPSAN